MRTPRLVPNIVLLPTSWCRAKNRYSPLLNSTKSSEMIQPNTIWFSKSLFTVCVKIDSLEISDWVDILKRNQHTQPLKYVANRSDCQRYWNVFFLFIIYYSVSINSHKINLCVPSIKIQMTWQRNRQGEAIILFDRSSNKNYLLFQKCN